MKYMQRTMATPAARQLAAERHIDLKGIKGSGEFGSIVKADIEKLRTNQRITPLARKVAGYYGVELDHLSESAIRKETVLKYVGKSIAPAGGSENVVAPSAMRRMIAERMKQSMDVAPQYTLSAEYDVSLLLERFETEKAAVLASSGTRITLTDVLVKLAAYALSRHELVNASLIDGMIHYHKEINIGVAVALESGLTVPVIRNVREKSIEQIAGDRAALVGKAREGRIEQRDIDGGTFTLSNLGMYPIDQMTPIINQPESAILGTGRVVRKPVVIEDTIAIRPMMTFSATADHRLIDGALLAEFMKTMHDCLEEPNRLFE